MIRPFRASMLLPLAAVALLVALSGHRTILAASIGPELQAEMDRAQPGAELTVLVSLRDKVDLTRFEPGRASAGPLIRALRAKAEETQSPVLHLLHSRGTAVRSFWIDNSIACRAGLPLIQELAARDDIEWIEFDVPIHLPEFRTEPAVSPPEEQGIRTAYWNMMTIHAPEVWAMGLDGTGVVVGSMDTGAEITHPALAGKWRGGTNSWHDAVNHLPDPYDDHGHGTHTIGTMVGGDGPGPFPEDIGLAYGARFISAKILDHNNSFSSVSIAIEGAQFLLDPDGNPNTDDLPHVINNSWAFGSQLYPGFYTTASAWRTAGIIPVFAIGNEGPAPASTRPPGNYNNVIGVGATTSSDIVWNDSSRGPSPNGTIFPPDLRKPDLCAPGAGVRSSWRGGGYLDGWGTSMAAPHVAGAVAILAQTNSGLSYDEARTILCQSSKDSGPAGYDYDYGYGRLNVFDAARMIAASVDDGSDATKPMLIAGPNPFHDHLDIEWTRPAGAGSSLRIVNVAGQEVRSFLLDPSFGGAQWDGRDAQGRRVPGGLYYLRLAGGDAEGSRTVLLIR